MPSKPGLLLDVRAFDRWYQPTATCRRSRSSSLNVAPRGCLRREVESSPGFGNRSSGPRGAATDLREDRPILVVQEMPPQHRSDAQRPRVAPATNPGPADVELETEAEAIPHEPVHAGSQSRQLGDPEFRRQPSPGSSTPSTLVARIRPTPARRPWSPGPPLPADASACC